MKEDMVKLVVVDIVHLRTLINALLYAIQSGSGDIEQGIALEEYLNYLESLSNDKRSSGDGIRRSNRTPSHQGNNTKTNKY